MSKGAIGALVVSIGLMGCAVTGERIRGVQAGMSEGQVVGVMGQPDGFMKAGEWEAYKYTDRLVSGWSWDRADYDVVFRDGVVVASGSGEVRQERHGAEMLMIMPVGARR